MMLTMGVAKTLQKDLLRAAGVRRTA